MAYGLRTFKENGAIAIDYTDRLTRVIYMKKLSKDESGSIQLAGFDPTKGAAFATILDNTTSGTSLKAAHLITTSGNWVYWAPWSPQTAYRTESWLYVVMYK